MSKSVMQKGSDGEKQCRPRSMVTRVLLLLCLTLSVVACKNAPPAPIIQLVREPVPESLTEETTRPALDEPVTWGAVAIFSDRLIDALDSCNADKAAIRQWDSLRQNTRKEP
ncbi:MAG: peptidase [Klebsiella michiganensis]|uniref:Rz1-like lysis system protein LysC n=1 Tax=Klebsiella/Raoultella group TaxID=2890311 RepID=UPI0013D1D612|nr:MULTISPECIES: peptidase [Klebsiella/Raoultella group]MDU4387825.1 peptidase [Klebsiella michiganensis]